MSWFSRNSGEPNTGSGNPLMWLLNLIVTVVALFALVVREPAVWLHKKVYSGWVGAFRGFLGVCFAFGTAYATGQHLGWELGYPTLAWLLAAAGAWVGTYFYAWPAIYHFVVRKIFDAVEWVSKKVDKVLKAYAEKVFNGLVLGLGYALPGSRRAWKVVLDKERRLWTNGALGGLGWMSAVLGTLYLGWKTYVCVSALAFWGIPVIPFVAGVAAGVLVASSVGALLAGFIAYGRIAFVATALTGGLTYLYHDCLTNFGGQFGLEGNWKLLALPVFALAFIGYIFPYLSWALSGDLVKKIFDKIGDLCDACYRDKNEGYKQFFAHTANIIATGAIAYGVYLLCGWIGLTGLSLAGITWLGAVATTVVVAASTVVAYLAVYDIWFDKHSRLGTAGFFASAYVAYKAGAMYIAAGLTGAYWLAIPVGLFSGCVLGCVVIPVVYLALRWVLLLVSADKAGPYLDKAYKYVETEAKYVFKYLDKVYERSYRDRTDYQKWFLHAANIGLAVSLYFLASSMCAWFGFGAVCTWLTVGSIVALSYIVIGQFLQRSDIGTEFVGVTTGLAAAIYVGTVLHAELANWWVTIGLGLFTWLMVGFLFFPLAYVGVRFVAKPLFAGWSLKPLAYLHGKAWSAFKVVYDMIVVAYNKLKEKVLVPFGRKVAEVWASVSAAYVRIRDRFGKRSS